MASLDGRVILVTGSAKRIGRGIALRLAQAGARVAIHYSNSESEARATDQEPAAPAPVDSAGLGMAETGAVDTSAMGATGAMAVAAVVTGVMFHWDDMHLFEDGLKDPDTQH